MLSLQLGASRGSPQLTAYGVTCVIGAVFGLGLLLWSIRIPIDRTLPMPEPVRWSFVIFIVALLIVATRLIRQTPYALPWTTTPELSVVIGWMFFGAAIYFAYGLLRPSWLNAAGQLIGFLAYDAVLIVPFLTLLPNVPSYDRTSLVIYIAVVTFNGLLAIYYLLVHEPTRARTCRRTRTA
ncbi:MAG: hypothetical protein QN120_06775 [Armatimonadota bacterium]|nr:hypothetical protein [Armatimonadota bacterium]